MYIVWSGPVFEETAIGISDALFISGFDAKIIHLDSDEDATIFQDDQTYIILGIHRFNVTLPKNFIVIQAEQINSRFINTKYLSILAKARSVWDFSGRNVEYFQEKGIKVYDIGSRVPMDVFYPNSPSMLRHFSGRHKDIDVLFYGAKCPRRENLEKDLKRIGLKTEFRYNNLFRGAREDLIARSKVVLNIHYYVRSSLETHRIEYLCSRGKCVVSERSDDHVLDDKYAQSVVFSSMEDMVSSILNMVTCEKKRNSVEVSAQKESITRQSNTRVIVESLKSLNNS